LLLSRVHEVPASGTDVRANEGRDLKRPMSLRASRTCRLRIKIKLEWTRRDAMGNRDVTNVS